MTPEQKFVHDRALAIITQISLSTTQIPIIFTSCCKKQAEAFVEQNDSYALIHTTPAGKALEDLNLFNHMSQKLAYLYWFILSTRFIIENDFPDEAIFFANPENPTSTAFGIEIPLLYTTKPNVATIFNPLTNTRTHRDNWAKQGLIRSYVLELINTYVDGPASYEMNAIQLRLFKKFEETEDGMPTTTDLEEARIEIGLKIMLTALITTYGNFSIDNRRGNNNPLTCALENI